MFRLKLAFSPKEVNEWTDMLPNPKYYPGLEVYWTYEVI